MYNPLPKLAVSAKLICLLMVLSCGALSSAARYVRLYNKCAGSFLMIQESGLVLADPDILESVYQNLTVRSVGFSANLTIYNKESKRFLCFSQKKWRLFGSKRNRGEMCQFKEEMVGGYTRYLSAAEPEYSVGFTPRGKPVQWWERGRRGRRLRPQKKCLDFIKFDEKFNIDEHHRHQGGGHLPPGAGKALAAAQRHQQPRLRHYRRRHRFPPP